MAKKHNPEDGTPRGNRSREKGVAQPQAPAPLARASEALLSDLRQLIAQARLRVAQAVNPALILLYRQVGHRIRTNVLRSKRPYYGKEILPTLSAKLVPESGQGYSARNLAQMVRFAAYLTELPAPNVLRRKLHEAIAHARERLDALPAPGAVPRPRKRN
jgi:hypothetical protein